MNTDSELQSAAFRISKVVTPAFAAADAAAPLTEWALKIAVLMPALLSKDFSHLANVEELIGLCGFTTARKSSILSTSSCALKDSVLCSYTCL